MRRHFRKLLPWAGPLKHRLIVAAQEVKADPAGLGQRSFSQEGEDVLLAELMYGRETGHYVDVGAHHPIRCSNTYLFYLRGWSGLNIDAAPGSMKEFERCRPRDTNVECAISDEPAVLEFHMLDEPMMNTFDAQLAEEHCRKYGRTIVGKRRISTRRLAEVLDEHWPAGRPIDFLSVDVEGLDGAVLRSNDWAKYRPEFLLVENLGSSIEAVLAAPLLGYTRSLGYEFLCRGVRTCVFRRLTS